MGRKGDLTDFERSIVDVVARQAGLSISEHAVLLGFSYIIISKLTENGLNKQKTSNIQFSW